MIGTTLSSYEVIRLLGKGGMGEVWLAKDTRLDRDVAIKVLPEDLARDHERVLRFEREAKLLASFNHSNIAHIYGFEEADGKKFLVLEYVDGDTLANRIKQRALGVEEAIDTCRQVAEALEVAHENGVIHRDLKPGNVMVKEDGTVKVLDFGLARALQDEASNPETPANSPTITANYTKPGVVLGTAPYMSPEQARGRAVDKRSDIWSFGVILFECLTGETLFRGESATESMGAIMHKQPDWSVLPPDTPPTVHLLLRRMLTKDRKRRLRDIGDARIELEGALEDPASTSLGLASVALKARDAKRRLPAALPWSLALLGVLIGAAGYWKPWERAQPPAPIHLSLAAPEGLEFDEYDISPDGESIAYRLKSIGEEKDDDLPLKLRHLSSARSKSIRGTEGGRQPAFSSNGKWLAFARKKTLFRVRLDGSPPLEIASLEDIRWVGTWLNDEELFVVERPNTVGRINANTGKISPIVDSETTGDMRFTFAAEKTSIPDTLLTNTFTFADGAITRNLQLISMDGQQVTDIIDDSWVATLTPSHHLLFARDNTLLGARYDVEQRRISGDVTALLADVERFKFVPTGTLIHGGENWGSGDDSVEIVRVSDPSKPPTVLSIKKRDYRRLQPSPDGRRIATGVFRYDGGTPRIWVLDLETGIEQPFSAPDVPSVGASWSPDGTQLMYNVLEPPSVVIAPIDGSSEAVTICTQDAAKERVWVSSWAKEGSVAVVTRQSHETNKGDILFLSLADGSLSEVLATDADEGVIGLSPDDNVIAYESDVSGDRQVYLQKVDLTKGLVGIRRRVDTRKALNEWNWSADGKSLLGIDGDGQIWSVSVTLEPELAIAPPEKLINVKSIDGVEFSSWMPSPDGTSHLFLREEEKRRDFTTLHVVLNFQTLLDRSLAATGH